MPTLNRLRYNAFGVDWSDTAVPTLPESKVFSEWILVRKNRAFSRHSKDGVRVYQGALTYAEDTNLLAGIDHYYSLYCVDTDGDVHRVIERIGKDFPVGRINTRDTYGYEAKLYEYLPEVYRRQDSLFPDKPLERFLKLPAWILEELHVTIDRLRVSMDVDEINYEHLPFIGQLVGWEPNFELPILRQREEIKMAVHVYKRKGTASGLRVLVESVSGWEVEIREFWKSILIVNVSEPATPDTDDPLSMSMIGEFNDPNAYLIDLGDEPGWFFPNKIGIYLTAVNELQMFDVIQTKMERILKYFLPAGVEGILIIRILHREKENNQWRMAESDEGADLYSSWFRCPDAIAGVQYSDIYPESMRESLTNDIAWRCVDTGIL